MFGGLVVERGRVIGGGAEFCRKTLEEFVGQFARSAVNQA